MDTVLANQIVVGAATSLVNLVIHALLLAVVVWTVRHLSPPGSIIPGFMQYTVLIVSVGTLLVVGHFIEVMVWANTYAVVDGAPSGTDLIYLAFSNYNTLSFGDVTLHKEWQILAPMTALNGFMLIGWSTALIIEILRQTGHAATRVLRPAQDAD